MKKLVFLCILVFIAPMFIRAQGFYFDTGINLGLNRSTYVYEQVYDSDSDKFPFEGAPFPLAGHFELNAGYGPFGNIPVYVVAYGEIGSDSNITGGTGAGVLFYPWRLLQLGASVGVHWVDNHPPPSLGNAFGDAFNQALVGIQTDRDYEFVSYHGFAWDISVALDFGKKNHGFLLGLKYSGAVNNFSYSYTITKTQWLWGSEHTETFTGKGNGTKLTTEFTLFVKYAYRKKPF
ncbi:MAG: hypothetical protein LBH20_09500 [Treponema sp.]|jgi:hypothetical protein|nr:hypothetical protein [Treponema sp.]